MDSNLVAALLIALGRAVRRLLRAARSAAKLMIGAADDLTRRRSQLIAETASLRQQFIVLRRSIERPRLHRNDRVLLLILAQLCRRWRDALHVVNPETLLRWHRDLFKFVWRRRSRPRSQPMRCAPEVVTLIQAMAKDNALWGAERIRGEPLKLSIRVSRRTSQKYMRPVRTPTSIVPVHIQGLSQRIPALAASRSVSEVGRNVVGLPILGGLHHDYQWAA